MLNCVQLFATPWTIVHQVPLSMGFSRQEYWSGLPFPSPGCISDPGIKLASPALAGRFFMLSHQGSPCFLMKWSESRSVVSDSFNPGLHGPWNSPGQNTGVGSLFLLQGIFPTQGSNPGLLHCRWILYQLNHKGSPRKLKWVAYPFSSRSSPPGNQTSFSCIASGFFTNWAIREAQIASKDGINKSDIETKNVYFNKSDMYH